MEEVGSRRWELGGRGYEIGSVVGFCQGKLFGSVVRSFASVSFMVRFWGC